MKAGGAFGLRLALVCAACLVGVMGLAMPAGAKPNRHHPATEIDVFNAEGPTVEFQVRGSNGYRIGVEIETGSATIFARRDFGPEEQSIETAEYRLFDGGSATMRQASANFGRVGRVSVHFRPGPKKFVDRDPECTGVTQITRFGTFEGTIEFEGEKGFTRFEAKRVPGEVTYMPRHVCHFPVEHHSNSGHHHFKEPVTTSFFAAANDQGPGADGYVLFEATQSADDPEVVEIDAERSESRGAVAIDRNVLLEAPRSTFSFDSALNSAILTPPAPFTGSATFTRLDDHASRWEGPLTVSFPGLENVPLTGRYFSWALEREGG